MSRVMKDLPALSLSLGFHKDRSFFNGPFSKGDFIPNNDSLKDICDTAATTRSKVMTKTRTTPCSFLPSRNISPIAQLETPRIHPKLHAISQDTCNSNISQTSRTEVKRVKLVKEDSSRGIIVRNILAQSDVCSDINNYLDYLSKNEKNDPEDYLSRMRQRVIIQKEAEELQRSESLRESVISKELKHFVPRANSGLKGIMRGSIMMDTVLLKEKNYHKDLRRNTREKCSGTPHSPSCHEADVSSKLRNKRMTMKNMQGNMGGEELQARELAGEVTNNYESFKGKAAKYKKLNAKIEDLLATEGLKKVFTGKVHHDLPLEMRIFKDMVEYAEVPMTDKEKRASTRNMSVLSPSGRISIVKRFKLKLKLIKKKYESYERVNKELNEINVNYKIEEVKAWEDRLTQVQKDFFMKKGQVLGKISQVDKVRYNDLKKECLGVENLVSVRRMDLSDNGDGGDETLNMKINRELDEIMVSWKNNLERYE